MNYKLQGKGIFVFSDPAGANSVLALIDQLLHFGLQKKDLQVFTNSTGVFDKKYNDVVQRLDFDKEEVWSITRQFRPDYLFSATSTNDFEHNWRGVALSKKIRTIGFIDHWTNYLDRFTFNNETIFPDEIWVINEIARKEAIEAGLPENRIVISGNPYYEKVKGYKPTISKQSLYSSLGLNSSKKTILFISDNIKSSFAKDENGDCILGFDEFTVLKDVLVSLKELENKINYHQYQFVIKLHPRSEKNKFDSLIKFNTSKNLEILTLQKCDPLSINYYSDYVLGMFSNMVIESVLMGKKVLSLHFSENKQSALKFDESHFTLLESKSMLTKELNKYVYNSYYYPNLCNRNMKRRG